MRVHLSIATLLCVLVVNAFAQQLPVKPYVSPYVSEWHKVSVATTDKMPADAEATLRKIFSRAIADGHLFESLRAYEQLTKIKTEIDYQSQYASVDTLIANAKLYPHAPLRALYELLLARTMNQTYTRGNDAATNTQGLDYQKWSYAMRQNAIRASINNIISMGDTLSREPVGIYREFVEGNAKPKIPSNNLYVALLRALQVPIVLSLNNSDSVKTALYRIILAQTRGDAPLYITTYTDYIEDLNLQQEGTDNIYADSLSKLIARYPNEPAIVRAIEAKIYLENPELWQSEEPKVFLSLDSLCRATVKRFPDSPYIDQIKAISTQLHGTTFNADFPKQLYPGKSIDIKVKYRNMTNLTLSVWHLDGVSNISSLNLAQDSLPNLVKGKKPVWSKTQKFTPPLYVEQSEMIPVKIDHEGVYVIGAQSTDSVKMSYDLLYVSRVGSMYRITSNETHLFAADFESGKPLPKVELSLCSETVDEAKNKIIYGKASTQKLSIDGFTPIDTKDDAYRIILNHARYAVDYGKDIFSPTTQLYFWSQRTAVRREYCYIVTDRTRYMPGDTVRYKGVAYKKTDMGAEPDSLRVINVSFRSPSNSVIEIDTVNVDSWGSFSGYFVTKLRTLNGQYSINTQSGSAYVSVESYKTPTFAITLDNPTEGYALGDTMKLRGRLEAFAGYPLSSITLEYMVGEQESMWRRAKVDNSIQSYRVVCSPNGDFEICVPTKPNKSNFTTYQLVLKATDIKGESQEITRDFMLGKFRYILTTGSSHKVVNKDKPLSFTPQAMTFWGNVDSLRGKYAITDSKGGSVKGSFLSGEKYELDMKNLASGECKINMTLDGDDKCEYTAHTFTLFSPQDKALPVDTLIFFATTNTECSAIRPVTFTLGTNQSELYVQIALTYGDSLVHSESQIFRRGMNNYSIPYPDSYPDNTRLYINFIRAGKPYNITRDVSRTTVQEDLTLRLVTERKAAPGAKESIGIEVVNGRGAGVKADVTISVFDKSSEKYRKNTYSRINNSPMLAGYIRVSNGEGFSSQQIYSMSNFYAPMRIRRSVDFLDFSADVVTVGYGASKAKSTMTGSVANVQVSDITNENIMIRGNSTVDIPDNITDPVRRNFRQTAAFFPNIRTDAMGIARVSYTMPDALTTYRIEAFAYTRNLDSAVADGEIVVSKDVMIIPNTPLFIRLGDEITIKATVVNNSDKTQQATASLTLSNPDKTNAKIDFNGDKSITLAPMSSQVVEWSISDVPNVPVLAIKTSIETATQRDSEERLVAILSPDEQVVGGKTYIISNDSVRIDLRKFLKDGAKDEMMVVNSLSTPILLLNSLPFDKEVKSQNAIDMIESWYLSSVGHDMVRRYRTYISSLAKDLKTGYNPLKDYSQITEVLADETPWARQSEQPEERLRAMNDYLDGKATIARNREMFWAIEKLQNPDGGVSWFKGMPSSPALTAMLLDRYASLVESKYYSRCKDRLFLTSMAYLDRAITEQFRQDSIAQLGRKTKDLSLSTDLLNNLYIRSRFNDSIPRTRHDSIAFERLLQRAEKSWRKGSIMDMTLTALAMQNRGKDITPILNSLSQYAVKGSDGVVNYPNAVKYRSLISSETRAHALLMKLLTANQTTASLGEGVARWLMLQRHNQQWENNSATADAVQGLWKHYNTTGKPKNQVKVYSLYPRAKGSAALPYGNVVSTEALRIGSGTITVVNQNDMPRFVDVIYRYSAPMKDIEPRAEGISVTRKLLREKVVGDKKVLEEITESTPLNIGDVVVVRNILDSDADYSFVMLESKRSGATLPVDDSSAYRNGHYRDVKASTTNDFFYTLPRGATTIDERLFITYEGKFSDGIAKVVSLQNPTKGGNTASGKINVK